MVTGRRSAALVAIVAAAAACSGGGGAAPDSTPAPTNAPPSSAGSTTTVDGVTSTTTPVTAPPTTGPRFDVEAVLADTPMIGLNVTPPMPEGADLPLPPGMADFDELFTPDGAARWATALEHVDVYKVHAWQVRHFLSDEQLLSLFAFLDERQLPLMFETEPLPPPDPDECEHTESFEGPYDLEMAQRIHDLGGVISFVAVEEPYHFAHKLDTPGACRYPVERVVDEVIDYVRQMREIFPGVAVGTIEPIWSAPATTPDDMAIWLDTYEERAGEPFAFLHLDPDWYWDSWTEVAMGIEEIADARDVPIGILYNGGIEPGSAMWMQFLMEQAALIEGERGFTPQHVLIQSWVDEPELALPDDDVTALTSAVVRYVGDRTALSATLDGDVLSASVTTHGGEPIPGADVLLAPRTLGEAFGTATLRGTVPDAAEHAEILIRANFEGAGPGPTRARVTSISYTDGGDPANKVPNADFDAGLDGWGTGGGDAPGRVEIDGDGSDRWLAIEATADQQIVVNGGGQDVVPGSAYELTVTYSIAPEYAGSAVVAVEFPGLARHTLALGSPDLPSVSATTGSDGVATFDLSGFDPGPYELVFHWPGDLGHWPVRRTTTIELG